MSLTGCDHRHLAPETAQSVCNKPQRAAHFCLLSLPGHFCSPNKTLLVKFLVKQLLTQTLTPSDEYGNGCGHMWTHSFLLLVQLLPSLSGPVLLSLSSHTTSGCVSRPILCHAKPEPQADRTFGHGPLALSHHFSFSPRLCLLV